MRLRDLDAKRVVIWGAGREARSVLEACRRAGVRAELTIVDDHAASVGTIDGIAVRAPDTRTIAKADVVVRSPGVSKYRLSLRDAKVVTTATNLWFAEPHAPVIAVTGTKGKSTTSSLIAHLLQGLGADARLAGNIGRSPLDHLDEPEPDFWVLELSSYQTSDLDAAPAVAALTSLSPEHLDWHLGEENYVSDKLRLFAHAGTVVVNDADPGVVGVLDRLREPHGSRGEREWPSLLVGAHNAQLVRLAVTVLRLLGIDVEARHEEIERALATFEPLPHRLEPVADRDGVIYVDDSLSTTPVAAIAAMESFSDRPVTLLVGGYDRGLDYGSLADYVRTHANVTVIAMPDSGHRIAETIDVRERVHEVDGLADGVALASTVTPTGGVVLLSPAAPSFGRFKDYAERGQAFADLARGTDA